MAGEAEAEEGEKPKRRRYVNRKCMVNNCPNTKRRNKDKTFFRFPPDKRFGWKWIKASHNMELARLGPQACCEDPAIAMCQDHFDYRCFCSDSKVKLRLAIDSVPTVNLDLPSRLKTKRKRASHLPPPKPARPPAPVVIKRIPLPERPAGMSDEKYAKLVETIRYMNREKLERARARRLRHARGREVRLEGEDPDGEGEGEDDNDDDNDDHAAEECAALLQDDPQLGTSNSPSKSRKRPRVASSGKETPGQCLSLLYDDDDDAAAGEAVTGKRGSANAVAEALEPEGDVSPVVVDLGDDRVEEEAQPRSRRRLEATRRAVKSIQSLVRELSDRRLTEMDEEPVCIEINSHTLGTKFEIDIQCSSSGRHQARMITTKQ